jgi:hypothetical protein
MAYENVNLKYPHMLIDSGYFCMFDISLGVYYKYLCDGNIAFSYPLLTIPPNNPKCIAFDGTYIWSLHDGTVVGSDIKLYKWLIENEVCKLVSTFTYTMSATDRYSANTFTVEHYDSFFSEPCLKDDVFIYLNPVDISLLAIGDTLFLGPNENAQYEEVEIIDIFDTYVEVATYVKYNYKQNEPINIIRSIWLFNNYSGLSSTGAIYKFKPNNGSFQIKYEDDEYRNITACCFGRVTTLKRLPPFYTIAYVKNNSLKYMNLDDRTNYCVANIDNIKVDNSTTIPVKALIIYKDSVYRLQQQAMFFGVDTDWDNYNYQVTPIREFIDSITVDAYPKIVPCNGVNISEIEAVVMDQYSLPIKIKPVGFFDDNSTGYITTNPAFTSEEGVATSVYKSGISPATVTITAIATQYD